MWYSWIFALGEWHICIANFSGFLNFYNKYLQIIGMCYSNNCDDNKCCVEYQITDTK